MGLVEDKPKGDDVIAGDFKEQGDAPERGVAVVQTPQQLATWKPRLPAEVVDEQIEQREQRLRYFKEVMKSGVDYSIIPGQKPTPRIDQATGQPVMVDGKQITDPPKPALLKPGAEKLNAAMGLHPVMRHAPGFPKEELRGDEWYIEFERVCSIYVQTGPGENDRMLVAEFSGSCNSWEEKYRYRGGGRTCPECSANGTIIKGNPQYAPKDDKGHKVVGFEQGGWLCWKKKDGCGATFPDGDRRITEQDIARVKNPNPHDLKNTLLKMADKRALVASTLIATGCSDLFTQDIEDKADGGEAPTPATNSGRSVEPQPGDADARPKTPMDEATVTLIKARIKDIRGLMEQRGTPAGADAALRWAAFSDWMKKVGSYDALFADDTYTYAAKKYLGVDEAVKPVPADSPLRAAVGPVGVAPAPANGWKDEDKAMVRETMRAIQGFAKEKLPRAEETLERFKVFMDENKLNWAGLWSRPDLRDKVFDVLELVEIAKPDADAGFDPDLVPE